MPKSNPPTPPSHGGGANPAVCPTGACPTSPCVTKITAKIPGTKGKRVAANQLPENVLAASTSAAEGLAANPPVILVRGCTDVQLASETTPPNQPVTWTVKPNENTGAAPTITPTDGGKKATLKTDKTGSFSVIATLGSCKVVWNVVFCWVKVDPATSAIIHRDKYVRNGGGTGFKSGDFTTGKFAMAARVSMRITGGGTGGKLGVGKIMLHTLQNGTGDSLTAHYQGGGTMTETPSGGLPVVDANDESAASPFSPYVYIASCFQATPSNALATDNDVDRAVWTGDSPGGGFPAFKAGKRQVSISGTNDFRTSVAATSMDAPNAIVVHAAFTWTADFSGTMDAAGHYHAHGAKTVINSQYTLISDGTGGQDACDAGFEVFPPIFRDVVIA